LIRLQSYEVDNRALGVDIQNTNYFSHFSTLERPELDKENRADPLSVGSVLHTSDDYIVLGEKSGNLNKVPESTSCLAEDLSKILNFSMSVR
jgi:hypothetical protein